MSRRSALESLISVLGAPLLEAFYRTLRVKVVDGEIEERLLATGRPLVYVIWHGRMLCPLLFRRRRRIVSLVSLSRDGEIINRFLLGLGYLTVRGSSSRGGVRGLVQLVREVRAGRHAAVTPDGPRGPRCRVQEGVLELAARTGAPLLPLSSAARRAVTCKSWDRFVVPLPFSRVFIQFGKPLRVAPEDRRESREAARLLLEEELNRLTEEVDALCRR